MKMMKKLKKKEDEEGGTTKLRTRVMTYIPLPS